ncbi:MAG TPA: VOC family protein, partial [Gemmatimonadales bacterium]|nr:VOC family protein [Gemmatimonadales bacterium]
MPVMESYAPGTFCWADLGTPDAAVAKRFYTSLFGWIAEDRPLGPGAFYTMLTQQGRAVAALYAQDPASGAGSPHWLNYISVESANDAARRTRELGGTVVVEPFDVLDVGRMALVQDVAGAVVAVWQPRRHVGAGVRDDTGAMCWNELATTDTMGAEAFYAGLFGWSATSRDIGGARYTTFARNGEPCGGMLPIDPARGALPPHWMVYFAVSDCDGQVALVQSLGGAVRVPPTDVADVGRFAVVADPEGAAFAILEKAARA